MTVVMIDGVLNMDDIARLSGNMGVPNLRSLMDIKKPEDKTKRSKKKD